MRFQNGEKRSDRDGAGRFRPGGPAGPGRPLGSGYRELRRALSASITPETIGRIVAALVERAEKGDAKAAALLLAYAVGKPLDCRQYRRLAENLEEQDRRDGSDDDEDDGDGEAPEVTGALASIAAGIDVGPRKA